VPHGTGSDPRKPRDILLNYRNTTHHLCPGTQSLGTRRRTGMYCRDRPGLPRRSRRRPLASGRQAEPLARKGENRPECTDVHEDRKRSSDAASGLDSSAVVASVRDRPLYSSLPMVNSKTMLSSPGRVWKGCPIRSAGDRMGENQRKPKPQLLRRLLKENFTQGSTDTSAQAA